ncbi:hypothetical protein ETAA8_69850 [Anatilimnocola aggregata]|uniref:Uncharacterized protein n=1 Tax=Anatilimnocola aggregata TaxID=2528021 RepID=A0A517YNM1_9BACT|nr:hypothetical protein [Anatilimnocola aggregata]QDU31825.1 hypothetical protein ETAA8_69850 [Anatilimnocola aggregata]
MNLGDLLEIGAVAATHAPVFIECRAWIPHGAIEQYWSASKSRQERWYRLFRGSTSGVRSTTRLSEVVYEVLASELLTRVFTAMCAGHDRASGHVELEPIAHSILLGHLEARNCALQWMVTGEGIDLKRAVDCNRFRRRIERWTDMLLGRMAAYCDPTPLAFEPERAIDFSEDFDCSQSSNEFAWSLALAATRASFQTLTQPTFHADLNREVASSVLGCLGTDVFDSLGLGRSLWLERLSRTASDTQGMIDQLIRLDAGLPTTEPHRLRGTPKRRRKS